MTLNSSGEAVIAKRRVLVASLRLKGYSQRQIWQALAYGGRDGEGRYVNPNTGEPFSLGTINADIKALEQEWRTEASRDTDIHRARQLSEIQAIKSMAFIKQNPMLALRAIDLEMKLLGTSAPARSEVTVKDWRAQAIEDIRTGVVSYGALVTVFEDESLAAELFREAGVPVS